MPKNIVITNIKDSAGIDDKGDYYSQFSIFFEDDPNKSNFYEVAVWTTMSPNIIWYGSCTSDDIIIKEEGNEDYYPRDLLFSDKLINGLKKEIKVNIYPPAYSSPNGERAYLIDPYYTFIVHFRSISENYYKYKKTLIRHMACKDGGVFGCEPVEMYSNIEGGLGIFAGYSSYVDTIWARIEVNQ